ncbi:hypothetical protein SO802_021844 [Lithocarpus litseifolius]|uniref:Uncharacterized protein n=1 Tax=Lithocarpus litseifolius TaxID=425828 RepID=A0AAW2CI34_9ROSI
MDLLHSKHSKQDFPIFDQQSSKASPKAHRRARQSDAIRVKALQLAKPICGSWTHGVANVTDNYSKLRHLHPIVDFHSRYAVATEGQEVNVVTDYIVKVLGLEVCADTLVGNQMLWGISGGQRKRVTTGDFKERAGAVLGIERRALQFCNSQGIC